MGERINSSCMVGTRPCTRNPRHKMKSCLSESASLAILNLKPLSFPPERKCISPILTESQWQATLGRLTGTPLTILLVGDAGPQENSQLGAAESLALQTACRSRDFSTFQSQLNCVSVLEQNCVFAGTPGSHSITVSWLPVDFAHKLSKELCAATRW